MAARYPEIEPYEHGMLDVGNGNLVYWEQCGNPEGKPVVVLHGGPGSGCTPGSRRSFDPDAYRIVLFDQRNCGRSTPLAGDPATDLSHNTTHHLIADIEQLREHLGIGRWMVWGASWGATLALAYAERFPERVTEILLIAVTNTRRSEVDWLVHGVRRFYPEAWSRFEAGVPEVQRSGNLAADYRVLLNDPDPKVREEAAGNWCEWEDAIIDLDPGTKSATRFKTPRFEDPAFRYQFARLVTHYFSTGAWLEEGEIIRNAHRLAGIPGILIHGQLDLSSPLDTAWDLHQAWPESELVVLGKAGHSSGEGMQEALMAASDRFAKRP